MTDYFRHQPLPEKSRLAGFAYIREIFQLQVPIRRAFCVSDHHIKGTLVEQGVFTVYDKRYWPGDSPIDHLEFALKFEDLDMLCLKEAISKVSIEDLTQWIKKTPTGKIHRKLWYYYEQFTGSILELADLSKIKAEPLLQEDKYFTGSGTLSRRHRIYDNHIGTAKLAIIVRRTPQIEQFIASDLAQQAQECVGKVSREMIGRAASFLLLADSRASFAIEGERPPRSKLERWGQTLLEAGQNELSMDELERLHRVLIEDNRFTKIGLRDEEVFLGVRDQTNQPLPEFIGAKKEDLEYLMQSLLGAHQKMIEQEIHPVIHAVIVAFAFVYVHPLEDGNGRLHRYLLHHILAKRGFTPKGLIFPISAALLEHVTEYKEILQNHSSPLMEFIEWESTSKGNVKILNETLPLYQYIDATESIDFIFSCIKHTIEVSLPEGLDYLGKSDRTIERIMNAVEMPDQKARQFIIFVQQNQGKLSSTRREKDFAKLSDLEVIQLETIVKDEFS
jgi:hypothetical protein